MFISSNRDFFFLQKAFIKSKVASRATDDFSHINTFNQIKKYEKNYNFKQVAFLNLVRQMYDTKDAKSNF